MQINRLVHPGFWFGKTKVEDALKLARLGVGGFCFYGGTRKQVAELARALRAQSPLPKILIFLNINTCHKPVVDRCF